MNYSNSLWSIRVKLISSMYVCFISINNVFSVMKDLSHPEEEKGVLTFNLPKYTSLLHPGTLEVNSHISTEWSKGVVHRICFISLWKALSGFRLEKAHQMEQHSHLQIQGPAPNPSHQISPIKVFSLKHMPLLIVQWGFEGKFLCWSIPVAHMYSGFSSRAFLGELPAGT